MLESPYTSLDLQRSSLAKFPTSTRPPDSSWRNLTSCLASIPAIKVYFNPTNSREITLRDVGQHSAMRLTFKDSECLAIRCEDDKGVHFVQLFYPNGGMIEAKGSSLGSNGKSSDRAISGSLSFEDARIIESLLKGNELEDTSDTSRTLRMAESRSLTLNEELLITYGEEFCNKIGLEHLGRFPLIETAELGVQPYSHDWPFFVPHNEKMREHSLIRFADQHYVGIALRVMRRGPDGIEKPFVETIYKEGSFSLLYQSAANRQIGSRTATDLSTQGFIDFERGIAEFATVNYEKVIALLNGETVESEREPGVFLRKA